MSQGIFHGGSSLNHSFFNTFFIIVTVHLGSASALYVKDQSEQKTLSGSFLFYRNLAALLARSFTPQSTELHNICIFENLAYRGISNFYIPFFKSEQLKQHATCYRPSQITSRRNRFGESIRDESYLTDQGQICNLRKQKLFGFTPHQKYSNPIENNT